MEELKLKYKKLNEDYLQIKFSKVSESQTLICLYTLSKNNPKLQELLEYSLEKCQDVDFIQKSNGKKVYFIKK